MINGGNATLEAPMWFYSIAVIYSYLPLNFTRSIISLPHISTLEGKVVPRAKPVSSTLKISVGRVVVLKGKIDKSVEVGVYDRISNSF